MKPQSASAAPPPRPHTTAAVTRGAARCLGELGFSVLREFDLPDGRRADLACLGAKGEFVFIEVKSGLADFQTDAKWTDYRDWCDRLFFAVDERFPHGLIPDDVGLIVADAYGGAIVRDAPETPLAPARRKALTLRYARASAVRLEHLTVQIGDIAEEAEARPDEG